MPFKILSLILLFVIMLTLSTSCRKSVETSAGAITETSVQSVKNNISDNTAVALDTVVDVFDVPDIKSSRITQVLFNQPVEIAEEKNGWSRITVEEYSGWVKSNLVSRDCSSIDQSKFRYKIIVTGKSKKVSSHSKGGVTIKEVAMGTILFSRGRVDGNYEVVLPGDIIGWVSESGTIQLGLGEDIPLTSSADFVATALKYKGTSYLSRGISSWGIDEPDLISICASINGIPISGDIREQYKAGTRIDVKAVTPGDLLFFGKLGDTNDINSVGIYLGDDKFLYASSIKGYVSVNSLNDEHFREKLAGARRIFQH